MSIHVHTCMFIKYIIFENEFVSENLLIDNFTDCIEQKEYHGYIRYIPGFIPYPLFGNFRKQFHFQEINYRILTGKNNMKSYISLCTSMSFFYGERLL